MSQLWDVEHSCMDTTDILNNKRQVTPELEHIHSIGQTQFLSSFPQVSPMDPLLNLMVLFPRLLYFSPH